VERRTAQAPAGVTALKIANRTVDDGKTAVDPTDVRAEDLENAELKGKVEGILAIANGDGNKHVPEQEQPVEASKPELTPEQQWFGEFKARFDALPQLHKGVQWADVEKSLKADPEQLRKLQTLDEKGHNMNVFGEENGEFIFVSAWRDYKKVSPDHRNIAYDLEGQELAKQYGYNPHGNAVDIIKSIGADLADPKFHEQLRREIAVNGWAWLKTDAATRKTGDAFDGFNDGTTRHAAYFCYADSSFRAALRVSWKA